jgi:CheY-like chemotaxis protein
MSIEPADLPRRILVVDDSSDVHAIFRGILMGEEGCDALDDLERDLFGSGPNTRSNDSYDMEFALQGREGLQRAEEALSRGQPFMVAFVDMRMPPGWDGLETIERIWRVDPDIQVVICTAYSDYSWEEIVQRLGKTDKLLLLKKPFDTAEVAQIASALVHKWLYYQQSALKLEELEVMVAERTRDLQEARQKLALVNERLEQQVEERTAEVRRLLWQKEEFIYRLELAKEDLASLNHTLEQRVAERTAEIERLLQRNDELMGHPGHDLESPSLC